MLFHKGLYIFTYSYETESNVRDIGSECFQEWSKSRNVGHLVKFVHDNEDSIPRNLRFHHCVHDVGENRIDLVGDYGGFVDNLIGLALG